MAAMVAAGLTLALAEGNPRAQSDGAMESGHAGDTVVLQGGNDEYFIGGLPSGWRMIAGKGGLPPNGRGWTPAGQNPENPKDSIVFQVLAQRDLPEMSAMEFIARFAQGYRERCPSLLSTEFKPVENPNGFDDQSVILACPRNEDTSAGEVTLYRAIGGADTFYLIQRQWRLPPFTPEKIPVSGKQFDAATKAVEFGYACRIGDRARPCPEGWDIALSSLNKSTPTVVFQAAE